MISLCRSLFPSIRVILGRPLVLISSILALVAILSCSSDLNFFWGVLCSDLFIHTLLINIATAPVICFLSDFFCYQISRVLFIAFLSYLIRDVTNALQNSFSARCYYCTPDSDFFRNENFQFTLNRVVVLLEARVSPFLGVRGRSITASF